jgi:hypothetical protein
MNPTCKDCEKELRCEDCRYWVLEKNDPSEAGQEKDGVCRVNPPQVLLVPMPTKIGLTPGLSVNGFFPKTRPDLWCGKFMRLTVVGKLSVVELPIRVASSTALDEKTMQGEEGDE